MADKFQDKYRIPSARATFHDYSGGMYFVTICTAGREHYFGKIVRDCKLMVMTEPQMILSPIGQYVNEQLANVKIHYPYAEIPLFVVMPDHVHAIVIIDGENAVINKNDGGSRFCRDVARNVSTDKTDVIWKIDVARNVSTGNETSCIICTDEQPKNIKMANISPHKNTLAVVIRGIKSSVTKFANENNIPFVWQPRFYDRIIRNIDEMNRIAEYIEGNVARWGTQDENFLL